MATINAASIDACKRTQFLLARAGGGFETLGYELVVIDADDQFYELVSGSILNDKGQRRSGVLTPPVVLQRNGSLPKAPDNAIQEEYGVFEYHGI